MNIAFYLGRIQKNIIGGGFTFEENLLNAIPKFKTNHKIFFYYRNEKILFENSENIKYVNMQLEQIEARPDRVSMFNEFALRDKINLVYYIKPDFEDTEIPYIYTVWDLAHRKHSYFPEVSVTGWKFKDREKRYSTVIPQSTYTVIGNEEGKNQVCKYYGMDEERVFTNPMPTPEYVFSTKSDDTVLTKYNLEKNRFLFYPAQFWPHKNHITLLKAMKQLKSKGFKLALTGSDMGNLSYIKEKVKEFELENCVEFLGFVTQEEIISLYNNAYCLVFASAMGPDNIPPLEAMALSCPVISSKADGMEEQLKDSALFFDTFDANSLVEQITLLDEQTIKAKLITNGLALCREYSTENYIKKMFKMIDEFSVIRECWSSSEQYIHT